MKDFLSIISLNWISLIAVLYAFYLLSNDKEGWGWFLLIAILCITTPEISNTNKK